MSGSDIGADATVVLRGLAQAGDGAVWVVGDAGFGGAASAAIARAAVRVELGTTVAPLMAVYAVGNDVVALGGDGIVRRWRDGAVSTVATGAPGAR